MLLREKILLDQKEAMKERAEVRLETLRMLWSAIRNAEIDKGHKELTDLEVQKVAATQMKQLKDANLDFSKGGRQDLVEKTNAEIEILQTYLPEQLSDDVLMTLVKKVLSEQGIVGASMTGKAIGLVMKEVGGRAEGDRVRTAVAQVLTG